MDIVRRAALEASEAIPAEGGGRLLVIRSSFDEFNFDLELLHEGEPLLLGEERQGRAMAQQAQQRLKRRWIWMR